MHTANTSKNNIITLKVLPKSGTVERKTCFGGYVCVCLLSALFIISILWSLK